MQTTYSYESALRASGKAQWRIEDLIGGERRLDLTRPLLPETLARVDGIDALDGAERMALNQIRGLGYLVTFGLVEEFILPFVLDHARPHLSGDDARTRALLAFAGEEAKHIDLFKRFRADFEEGFGSPCAVIGPPEAIAAEVLRHHPLGVALAILHIEWMTQRHYLDSVRDDQDLDPQFKSLLRHHWMEEAQHAKLDTIMVETLAAGLSGEEIGRAVDEYLEIGLFLDGGLMQQVELDVESLERFTGRELSPRERDQVIAAQQPAIRWTFLGSGMTHPRFLETLERIRPAARAKVEEVAPSFC